MTIIIVSHSMEDVAKIAERIIVMNDGKIALKELQQKYLKKLKH